MRQALLMAAAVVVALPVPTASATAVVRDRTTLGANETQRLYRLFKSSDAEFVRRNPLEALFRGDARANDRFGDYITDSYYAAERHAAARDLAALRTIDRGALSPEARIAYDSFRWQRQSDLEGLQPALARLTKLQPLDQLKGFQVLMPQISAGGSVVPFATASDYEANLRRLSGYADYLDRARRRLREGLAARVTEPRIVIQHVAGQLDEVTAKGIDASPFFAPVRAMPNTIAPAERRHIADEYRSMLSRRLLPAQRALSRFIRNTYLPKARAEPGLSTLPGGDRLYAHLVSQFTTTRMTPRQIHQLGLSEVARIERAMDKVRRTVGFPGTLRQFADYMRTSPRFAPASAEQLAEAYRAIQARVEAQLPQHFGRLPRAKLVVEPLSGIGAATAPNASYSQGPPDGARPGVFHFNVSDLPSRRTFYTESLFLHEGEPGHHLQDNIAAENRSLPPFLRFEGSIAFGEGWALYAEGLGSEFGLYRDPYQLYGRYTIELFRAARLVVDTGIHAFGWSRRRAIDYLVAHIALGRPVIEQEVDRYTAYPGQALAYKIGELRILALRHRAEQALGSRFDERAFHDMLLEDGRIPLDVLDRKAARWLAAQRRM